MLINTDSLDRLDTTDYEPPSPPPRTPERQSYPEIDLEHPITDIIRINNYNQQPSIDLIGEFRWKMKLLLMDKICSEEIKERIGRERAKKETKNKKRQSNEGDVDKTWMLIYKQRLTYKNLSISKHLCILARKIKTLESKD